MAERLRKLTAREVETITEKGDYSDGGGLYLIVDESGAKRWQFRFRWRGYRKEMGLGGTKSVSLGKAREIASACRAMVADGRNPIEERRASREALTFGEVADAYIEKLTKELKNKKHIDQWRMTLTKYAAPIRATSVDQVQTEAIVRLLKPIWSKTPETANRLRGRIERVLDAAAAMHQRPSENPARWRGHLENLLPKRHKLSRGNHSALPYRDVPALMRTIRTVPSTSSAALQLTILTACRSGEVLGARWSEIDLEASIWTIPPYRMKAGREHRVPLSPDAQDLLHKLKNGSQGDCIFPGPRSDKPLSNMAMAMLLRRLGTEVTVHGFRSSFRDWVGEETEFPREVAEAALAHVVGSATERAYRRGDALEKRRTLMDAWANYCNSPSSTVIHLPRRSA